MFFIAAMTAQGWEPGPGDPTIAGWIIFSAYLVVAAFAARTARLESDRGSDSFLWRALALACLGLALNKQLDLHNAITCLGRNMAQSEGWYRQRRTFQLGLIAVVVALAVASLWFVLRRLGPEWRRHRLTLTGMIILLTFIVMRAASFHHLDSFLHVDFGGIRLHAIIEFSAIGFLFLGAWQSARAASSRRWKTPEPIRRIPR